MERKHRCITSGIYFPPLDGSSNASGALAAGNQNKFLARGIDGNTDLKIELSGESTTDPCHTRQCSTQHTETANVPRTTEQLDNTMETNPLIMAHTLSTCDKLYNDVDLRGPDGLTPLMLASIRGIGLDIRDNTSSGSGITVYNKTNVYNNSPDIIRSLIMRGAAIDAQKARTYETPLHLAARYARAEAAKALLEAGANPNSKDAGGRTPLHTAVASDAQYVFKILLRSKTINLDAKTNNGTTPLILAVILATDGMVERLVKARVHIDAIDGYGKSALHWAAAVNNVKATLCLLQRGANKDARNQKKVQNQAARVVKNVPYDEHSEDLLRSLHWLPIRARIMLKVLVLVFRAKQGTAPLYIQSQLNQTASTGYSLRSYDENNFDVQLTRIKTADRSFAVCAPMWWNSLPANLKVL